MNSNLKNIVIIVLIVCGVIVYFDYKDDLKKEQEQNEQYRIEQEQKAIIERQKFIEDSIRVEVEIRQNFAMANSRVESFSTKYFNAVSSSSGEDLQWYIDSTSATYDHNSKIFEVNFTTFWYAYMEVIHPDEYSKSQHLYKGKLTLFPDNQEIINTLSKNEALILGERSAERWNGAAEFTVKYAIKSAFESNDN